MAKLNGLKSSEFVRSAIAQLETEGLSRETLEASMDWLEANADAVRVPRSGLMRRAECAAEQLAFTDAKPRDSFSDHPDWYCEEWLGWIPGMHDANFLVRAGASELALHAVAVSRLARVAERAHEVARRKARDLNSPQARNVRLTSDRLAAVRRTLRRQTDDLAKLNERLAGASYLENWPIESKLKAIREQREKTQLLVDKHERELKELLASPS